MRSRSRFKPILVALSVVLLFAASCGGDEPPKPAAAAESEGDQTQVAPAGSAPPAVVIGVPPAQRDLLDALPHPEPPANPGADAAASGAETGHEGEAPLFAQPWLHGARPLDLKFGGPPRGSRLLTLNACTHCDVGDGTLSVFEGDLSRAARTLFGVVRRGGPHVSDDGSNLALIACRRGCVSEGVSIDLTPSLYLSEDAGWNWREFALAEGIWTIAEVTHGDVLLARSEVTGRYAWQTEVVEHVWLSDMSEAGAPESRWTVARPNDDGPLSGLYLDGALVRLFSPAEISGLAESPDGRLAVALRCGACDPERHAGLVVLDANADTLNSYVLDLSPLSTASTLPLAIFGLRWVSESELWAQTDVREPLYLWRPLLIDLAAEEATSYTEPGAEWGDVVPLALGPARQTTPLRLAQGVPCVDLRPMPRERDGEDPIECVATGILTGESAFDRSGAPWLFVQTDAAAGWVAVGEDRLVLD